MLLDVGLLSIRLTGRCRREEEVSPLLFLVSTSLLFILLLLAVFVVSEVLLDTLSFDVERQAEEFKSIMLLERDRGVFLRNFTPFEATPLTSPTILSAEFSCFGFTVDFSSFSICLSSFESFLFFEASLVPIIVVLFSLLLGIFFPDRLIGFRLR